MDFAIKISSKVKDCLTVLEKENRRDRFDFHQIRVSVSNLRKI